MTNKELNKILKKKTPIDLSYKDLKGLDFSNKDLRHINFEGSDLRGSNFKYCVAQATNFSRCKLSRAIFFRSDLFGADFSQSDVSDAEFYGAFLFGARFKEAMTKGANFCGADLTYTDITSFHALKIFGFYHEGYLQIRNERKDLEGWLKSYKKFFEPYKLNNKDVKYVWNIMKSVFKKS